MSTAAGLRRETWTAIVVGGRVELGVPQVYPPGTRLAQVMSQPFSGRIRRFVAGQKDGGWAVHVHHTCGTVLCTCTPRIDYRRVS